MMARKYGLASDRLVAATMVDRSGRIITLNSTHHRDLLWAAKVTCAADPRTECASKPRRYPVEYHGNQFIGYQYVRQQATLNQGYIGHDNGTRK